MAGMASELSSSALLVLGALAFADDDDDAAPASSRFGFLGAVRRTFRCFVEGESKRH